MQELITISRATIGDASVQTVNARDLHAFLEIGKDFSTWIKVQFSRARLVDGRDFTSSPSRGSSGQHTIEYHLTLEAGKHIAMMSETDKGFEVRDYFIECEERAQAALAAPAPQAIGVGQRTVYALCEMVPTLMAAGYSKTEATKIAILAAYKDTGFLLMDMSEKPTAPAAQPAATTRPTIKRKAPPAPKYAPVDLTGFYTLAGLCKRKGLNSDQVNILLIGNKLQTEVPSGYKMTPKAVRLGVGKTVNGVMYWTEAAFS